MKDSRAIRELSRRAQTSGLASGGGSRRGREEPGGIGRQRHAIRASERTG